MSAQPAAAQHGEDGSEEEGSGTYEESDDEYDFTPIYPDMDDDDDDDYDLDLSACNYSSDILRILGKSDSEIEAKKLETAGTDWKPPTAAGLDNSTAIARSTIALTNQFAIAASEAKSTAVSPLLAAGQGPASPSLGTSRSSAAIRGDAQAGPAPLAGGPVPPPMWAIILPLEKVPITQVKGAAAAAAAATAVSDVGSDDSDDDDDDWDPDVLEEAFYSDCFEGGVATSNISPSLLRAVGVAGSAQAQAKIAEMTQAAKSLDWKPPTHSGLSNSDRLLSLDDPRNMRLKAGSPRNTSPRPAAGSGSTSSGNSPPGSKKNAVVGRPSMAVGIANVMASRGKEGGEGAAKGKRPGSDAMEQEVENEEEEEGEESDDGSEEYFSDGDEDVMEVDEDDAIIDRILTSSAGISGNLLALLAGDDDEKPFSEALVHRARQVSKLVAESTWKPPSAPGVNNSAPIVRYPVAQGR